MADDLKKTEFEQQHPRLARWEKNRRNHPIRFFSITILTWAPICGLTMYLELGRITGEYNPFTQWEIAVKQREEYFSEMKRLILLRDNVMRKAEGVDDVAGLSFSEQSLLARALGYEKTLMEGNCNRLGRAFELTVFDDKKIILNTGSDSFECSEKSLENYLNE